MTCDLLVRSTRWTLAERLAVVVSAVLLKRRRLVDCPTGGPLLPDSKGIDFSFAAAGGVTVEFALKGLGDCLGRDKAGLKPPTHIG